MRPDKPFDRYTPLQPNVSAPYGISNQFIYGAAGLAGFIALWAILGALLFRQPVYAQFSGFLPGPTLRALLHLMADSNFWASVMASLRRVLIGIGIAFAIGMPCGILIGFYCQLHMLTAIPIQFLRMISPLAWMPVALLVFKSFETAIYFLITIATVWPILINIMAGTFNVNPLWIQMARNQGAGNRQLLLQIILPASFPYIFTSLRLALGVAWIVLVPAEFLGVASGLGYMINDARDSLEYDRLMAIVIAIGILGYALDLMIQRIEKKLQRRH